MKKLLYCPALLLCATVLSSCEAHYGGKSYNVPWYYIAVPVAIWSVLCFVIAQIYIVRKTYKCPRCGAELHPKWCEISAWFHINDERVVKCHHCGRKGFCKEIDK